MKKYLTWIEFQDNVKFLAWQINTTKFKPNFIIGLTRGGACLATNLSYVLDTPVLYFDPKNHKIGDLNLNFNTDNILIVDDINDTGETIIKVRKQIIKTLHPETNISDDSIFSLNNIKFCVLYDNISSKFQSPDYSAIAINKKENNEWIVFPWEETIIENIYMK